MRPIGLVLLLAVLQFAPFPASAQEAKSWFGVVIYNDCSSDQAYADWTACVTKRSNTSKLALYDETLRQVYLLDPPQMAVGREGESVKVQAVLQGNTLHLSKLTQITSIGLEVGKKAPDFTLQDQLGKPRSLSSLKGPKGTVLLFFRSADWCPYCKAQLVQLQAAKENFRRQGMGLAAISYDTPEVLKSFADRKHIDYTMLSDPDSKTIVSYGVLNPEGFESRKGMALPGYFFIDPNGIIREKFFEAKYRERFSGNQVVGKLFPQLGTEVTDVVEAPHLRLALQQSDRVAFPGNRVTLAAEVQLPPDVHVYAPGVQGGYRPIKLTFKPVSAIEFLPATFPQSKTLFLPVINEKVAVFNGKFRITQDLKIDSTPGFSDSLGSDGKLVTIAGELQYQACDSKKCYAPATVPVQWSLNLSPLDRQRAPEAIRRK